MGYPQCPRDPSTFQASAIAGSGLILGQKYWFEGEVYQCVLVDDAAVTYADKQALTWKDRKTYAITNDITDTESATTLAGFATMVYTAAYYVLIKKEGEVLAAPKLAGDDAIAPHTPLFPSATTDGELEPIVASAANASVVFCWALDTSDDPADTVDVYFRCP